MKALRKVLRIKRGFTLLECVLAMGILAVMASMLLPMLSSSYNYIGTSQSLDGITSLAEQRALAYPYTGADTTFVTTEDGYSYAYANGFKAEVYFVVKTDIDVVFDPVRYNMIATIVKDDKDNMVVYYDIDPNDLTAIYARDYD